MEKLLTKPTKAAARKVAAKLATSEPLTEQDKNILYSYFQEYSKNEKSERARLWSFVKLLPWRKKLTEPFNFHYWQVREGKAYITDGFFLVVTECSFPEGTYNRQMRAVPRETSKFPDYQATIAHTNSHVQTQVTWAKGCPEEGWSIHITDGKSVRILAKHLPLLDLSAPLWVDPHSPGTNVIGQVSRDRKTAIYLMPCNPAALIKEKSHGNYQHQ